MNLCRQQKKKNILTKRKLKKGLRGSIAITLCLLLTPFLTLALSLVEYARYQEVKEVTDEIYELTGVSVLSDYDGYVHSRFGLLCTSQEGEIGNDANALLEENMKVLGKQATLDTSTISIKGKHALTNVETLRKQVVDFSELTVTSAIIAEDFKLEELLNKLQGVSQFQDIMNTVDSLADTAEALDTAVTKLETLQTELTEVENAISNAVSTANTLSADMADLYKKLGDNGITLPEDATAEQIASALESFGDTYLEDLKGLYETGNQLISNLESIKTNLGELKTAASDFISAVNDAKTAAQNISSQNSVDSDGNISQEATQTLTSVLGEMVTLAEDTLSSIKEDTINIGKSAIDEIISGIVDSSGLAEIATRYNEIVNGEYFSMPLSDTAKEDLTDLLKTVGEIYSTHDSDKLEEYFKSKFVLQPNINVESILDSVESAYKKASESISDSVTNKVIELLTNLVNIVKGLFDLDLFYEPDMNAFVNTGGASDSPYQDFLDSLGGMFTAIEDLKKSMEEDDVFSKLLSGLSAMKDMFSSMGKMLKSIWDIAGESVAGIMELAGSTLEGDVQGLYEKLLIAGYMRHNLPCRVNSGKFSSTEGEVTVDLTGEGLTGFAYNDIARSPAYAGQASGGSSFQSLQTLINDLQNGHGSDTMFRGAELEYIRAGTNSEIANQVFTFFDIYFLRLLLDLPSVFMDAEVGAVATAATIASWVVYILYIIIEPFCDTLLLVNGESVPLIRTDCWLTATGVGTFLTKIGKATMGEELYKSVEDYANSNAKSSNTKNPDTDISVSGTTGGSGLANTDYQAHVLIILLAFVESDTMISRLQDLIELEATEAYRKNGKSFSMSKTYTTVEVEGDITFNAFFDLGILNGGNPLLPSTKIRQRVSY